MARILIVEDEPDIALGLEEDLSRHGHDVSAVGDGETALRSVEDGKWDLILLDVMLPGRDGFEVCEEIRRAGVGTPVIFLTAKAHEAEKVLGLDLGADDYVTKPFSPRELRSRISAVLRRTAVDSVGSYQFGECETDFDRCEVRRNGALIEISAQEFRLLTVLIHHRGIVMSRDQLIDAAWGKDTFVTDRVVDTHVWNLRKKLEPVPAQPEYISSIRGMGYRFEG